MKRLWSALLAFVCMAVACGAMVGCGRKEERTRYEIVAEYRPSDCALTGTVKVDFYNASDVEFDCLKFNLYANAYREDALYAPVAPSCYDAAYYAGESYGGMQITSVSGVKQWDVGGEDKNSLFAYLEEPVYPGERVVLDVGFSTKLAAVNHRAGVTAQTVNLGGCIPLLCGIEENTFVECVYENIGDPFVSDCADFTVHITVPKEYTLAATGVEVEEKILESKKRHTMYASNVRDFAFVLSDSLKKAEGTVGQTKVQYYYLQDDCPLESVAFLQTLIAFYTAQFGEYPYPSFSLVQTALCMDSAEYPMLSMVSSSLSGEELLCVLAHEVAHQWWYAAVGTHQITQAWQDEGLAEFSALHFFEKHSEYGVSGGTLLQNSLQVYQDYRRVYESALGWVDHRMSRPLSEYASEYEYHAIAYDRSVMMWDTLRAAIGEKKLLLGLRTYYAENKGKRAMPSHLVGAFERIGVDLHGFFEGYLLGKGTL